MENITAMVSCFARAYHTGANACPVFSDTAARALLGSDYEAIAQNMLEGMDFFLPDFRGTPEEMAALLPECGFAVREQLSAEDMNRRFFAAHNRLTPQQPLYAPEGVGYLLAARR